MIDEALGAEERDLLRAIGEEPGFFAQAFSVFTGPAAWVNVVLAVVQAVFFIAGVWAAWNFFEATDALAAVRWGLPAVLLLLTGLIIKMTLWPTLQTNRVIRELKRIELQLARTARH
ncbi:MAG TPA: DUF6768 family protein [Sphingomicrobium sp.]|nr:DUF6768 family protein [Sphingomicrobium sp.]